MKRRAVTINARASKSRIGIFIYEDNKNRPRDFVSPADESREIIADFEVKSKNRFDIFERIR